MSKKSDEGPTGPPAAGGRTQTEKAIRYLVFLSVALGALLLVQTYGLLPQSAFYSIAVGWIAYIATVVLVERRNRLAYPLVLFLSLLALAVSLPQSVHWAFFGAGLLLAAATFLVGSATQIALVILILYHFAKTPGRIVRQEVST